MLIAIIYRTMFGPARAGTDTLDADTSSIERYDICSDTRIIE